ncbi:MAG: oxidoreductase [Xanthobacteraceae bacterium]|jgi:2-hydroxychromene-2-carboxylate isomerase|nr:oxidoreductase [Xanthobacteraceae bacterium]
MSADTTPRTIFHYFSIHSPWAFLGYAPFAEVARRHGLRVEHRPVQLGELFSQTGGLPLPRRHPVRQRYRMTELKRWREKRGVEFELKPAFWPYEPALADRAVIATIVAGIDPDPLIRRLFAGVWQRQENMADPAALLGVLAELGISADVLIEAAGTAIAGIYAANQAKAVETDVFGSPSYVLDGEVFWGQDRIDLLDDALTSGRAPFTPEA